MASSTQKSRASSDVSISTSPLINPATIKFTKKERASTTIKLKKPAPKQTKPGNWKESEIIGDKKSDSPSSKAPPSPILTDLSQKIKSSFTTGRPLTDVPETSVCKHCKRAVLDSELEAHIKNCLKVKAEKARKKKEAKEAREREAREKANGKDKDKDKDGDTDMKDGDGDSRDGDSAIKSSKVDGKDGDDGKKGKKRKADGESEKAPKTKKKKEEPKPKAAKPKGPVDVEKQCGVLLPNGAQCARSLTCKSHSMGAKRAVPGRSLPYDMLLSQYQKKNQAKQQKAAIDANAPLQDENDGSGPVDSDEEKDMIMAAFARYRPQPLETRFMVSTLAKNRRIRLKQCLDGQGSKIFSSGDWGLNGAGAGGHIGSTGSLFAVPSVNGVSESDTSSRRPSQINATGGGQSRGSLSGASQRKQSVVSAS